MTIANYYINHQSELLSAFDVVAILKYHGINGLHDKSTGSSFYADHGNSTIKCQMYRASTVFAWLGY